MLQDQIKNYARKFVETAPGDLELNHLLRKPSILTRRFSDDGIVPNNAILPVVLYRQAVRLSKQGFDPATIWIASLQ